MATVRLRTGTVPAALAPRASVMLRVVLVRRLLPLRAGRLPACRAIRSRVQAEQIVRIEQRPRLLGQSFGSIRQLRLLGGERLS